MRIKQDDKWKLALGRVAGIWGSAQEIRGLLGWLLPVLSFAKLSLCSGFGIKILKEYGPKKSWESGGEILSVSWLAKRRPSLVRSTDREPNAQLKAKAPGPQPPLLRARVGEGGWLGTGMDRGSAFDASLVSSSHIILSHRRAIDCYPLPDNKDFFKKKIFF